MNPIAQPETEKLLSEVTEYIGNNETINEFCKLRLLKAAKNQPTLECEHAISSLIYTAAGDKTHAREQAFLALKYMEQRATMTHALISFQLNGFNLEVFNTISKYKDLLDDLEFAVVFIPFLLTLPNISWIERIVFMLKKTNRLDSYHHDLDRLIMSVENANIANREYGIDKNVIGSISELVASVSQKFSDVILNGSSLFLSPSGEWFSLIYFVELEDTLLTDLNWELGDKIIDMGLDTLPLVARFEVVTSDMKSLRNMYAS